MTDAHPQKFLQRYPLIPTLVTAVCCALFLMPTLAGFMIFLVAIPWLPWAIFTLVRAIRNPARRKFHLTQIGLWIFALSAAMAVHALRYYHARQYADEIVLKVKDWHTAHGEYPRSDKELGIDPKKRQRIGSPMYSYHEGEAYPSLLYTDTFQYLATWHYDFERDVWVYLEG